MHHTPVRVATACPTAVNDELRLEPLTFDHILKHSLGGGAPADVACKVYCSDPQKQ